MATLYVTENGVQVHKKGQRLLVMRGAESLQDIPLIKIDRVILMGRGVSVTTPTLFALSRQGIDVLFLNSHGGYELRMVGREHKNSRLRHTQAIATNDPGKAFKIAQSIVEGKVANQRVLVQRHAEGASWSKKALIQMEDMRKQVVNCKTLDELRGCEGLAARDYFLLLRKILHPPKDGRSWGFERRAYYPPTDPINALLSFGYTLLLHDLVTACQIAGLDPDLGFFHAINYGKPCMALDLEEEFRPVIVDSLVLYAVNKPLLGLEDFEVVQSAPAKGADQEKQPECAQKTAEKQAVRSIYLKESSRKRFITLYENRINESITYPPQGQRLPYRRIFEAQAYAMGRAILGETSDYVPFTIR